MQVHDYLSLIIIIIIIIIITIIIIVIRINFHLTSRHLRNISVIHVDSKRLKAKLTVESN